MAEIEVVDVATDEQTEGQHAPRVQQPSDIEVPPPAQTEQTDLQAKLDAPSERASESVAEEPVQPPILERAKSVAAPKAKAKAKATPASSGGAAGSARKAKASPASSSGARKATPKAPPTRPESPARWVEPPRIASHFDLMPQIDKALNDYLAYQQHAERERQAAVYRTFRPF